jgi:hypothetical protein
MSKSGHTEAQMIVSLKQLEAGRKIKYARQPFTLPRGGFLGTETARTKKSEWEKPWFRHGNSDEQLEANESNPVNGWILH